jgi:hypothetical protein
MNIGGLALVVCVGIAGTTLPLRGECIAQTVPEVKRRATLVFEGTVTEVTPSEGEYAAEMHVHRVWKGKTSSETTVYFQPSVDGPRLIKGDRRVVFAEPLDPIARKSYGLPPDGPPRSQWVHSCGGSLPPEDSAVRQLGRSRQPDAR